MRTTGILPDRDIAALFASGARAAARPLDADQIQPASLDLRLGDTAYRVRASFLPGEHNRVADIGGSTIVIGYAMGIQTYGDGEIIDNSVAGVSHDGAMGIFMQDPVDGLVAGNRVREVNPTTPGYAYGIYVYGINRAAARDNTLFGVQGPGIHCQSSAQVATGNLVVGFAPQIAGCTDLQNVKVP